MVKKTVKVKAPTNVDVTAELCPKLGGSVQNGICLLPENLATAKVTGLFANRDAKKQLQEIAGQFQMWRYEKDASGQCTYVYSPADQPAKVFKTDCAIHDNLCKIGSEYNPNLC